MINTTRQIERGYILKENITRKDVEMISSINFMWDKRFNVTMVLNGEEYEGNDLYLLKVQHDSEGNRVDNDNYIIRLKEYFKLNEFNVVFNHNDVKEIGFKYPEEGEPFEIHYIYITLKKPLSEYKVKFK